MPDTSQDEKSKHDSDLVINNQLKVPYDESTSEIVDVQDKTKVTDVSGKSFDILADLGNQQEGEENFEKVLEDPLEQVEEEPESKQPEIEEPK